MDEHETFRKSMKEMTGAERFRYFCDYYLIRTLAIMAAAGAVFWLIWHFTHLPDEPALYAFVFNDLFESDGKSEIIGGLAERLSADEDMILLDDGYDVGSEGDMQISTLLANERLDLIICPYDEFVKLAGEGTFFDLREVLGNSLYEEYENDFVNAPGYEERSLSFEDDPFHEAGNGAGESRPYGYVISKSERYASVSLTGDEFICGIVSNSKHRDNAVLALEYFMGE